MKKSLKFKLYYTSLELTLAFWLYTSKHTLQQLSFYNWQEELILYFLNFQIVLINLYMTPTFG